LVRGDKHKTNHAGRPAFWRDLAYDLEPLAAGARQRKADAAWFIEERVVKIDGK